MIINHNMNAMTANRYAEKSNSLAGKSMEKLSTGLRITKAADDAAGLTVSEKMRAQIRGLQQAGRNVQDGISLIQTSEGALNEVSDMLVRLKELGVQKASGTYATADITNIESEMTQLGTEIDDIITNTKFNSKAVFDNDVDISIDELGTTFTIETQLAALSLSNASTIVEIDTAIDNVNTTRSTLGAAQNRLEHKYNRLSTTAENTQAAESRIRDVDMASEMVTLSKQNILAQAAQSMLAQANQTPQNVLQLLR